MVTHGGESPTRKANAHRHVVHADDGGNCINSKQPKKRAK